MKIHTLADARTLVLNSGVVDWEWKSKRPVEDVLEDLAHWIFWATPDGTELEEARFYRLVAGFIQEVLGQDPVDYGLGK